MMVLSDGKIPKLRASCDACNESKVRCSQRKPSCERCARQGISCIYGLSRRTHKTAPRVGASGSAVENLLSGHIDPALLLGSSNSSGASSTRSRSNSRHVTPGQAGDSLDYIEVAGGTTAEADTTIAGRRFVSSADLIPDSDWQLAESISLDLSPNFEPGGFSPMLHNDKSTTTTTTTSSSSSSSTTTTTIPVEFIHNYLSTQGSGSVVGGDVSGLDLLEESCSPLQVQVQCSCRSQVVKQLLSLPTQFDEGNSTFEAQFAQLKQAITVSEDCLRCPCTSRDDMSILTTGILIGRIIEGFEMFLTSANQLMSPSTATSLTSSGDSTRNNGGMVPRLSWGLVQIEPDEEAELRYHMWLIQLRKLEKVLSQLSASIGMMRSAHANSAKILACQYIHVWMIQKAELLKGRYQGMDLAGLAAGDKI